MSGPEQKDASEEAELKIFKLKELSPPSGLSLKILQVVTDEGVDLEDVATVIEKSPELAGRILACANSAFYCQRGQVSSVVQAIVRVLGLSVTKSLALSLTLSSSFRNRKCRGFKEDKHWYLSVLTASLARALSLQLTADNRPDPGIAYNAGLLHDIGTLALVDLYPDLMSRVFEEPTAAQQQAAMVELVGLDSQAAGGLLARRWGLPAKLVDAITYCKSPGFTGASFPLVALVGVSAAIAERLYSGEGGLDLPDNRFSKLYQPEQLDAAVQRVSGHIEELKDLARLLAS